MEHRAGLFAPNIMRPHWPVPAWRPRTGPLPCAALCGLVDRPSPGPAWRLAPRRRSPPAAQLLRVAQHLHHQAVLERRDGDEPLPARDGDLREADLAGLAQGFADDDVALARKRVGRRHEIGPLEVAVVDVLGIDELHEVDGLLALELERVDLLGFERHVGVVVDLVALDDVAAFDLADTLHDLLVVDASAGWLVDLAERDLALAFDRVVDLDADRDEAEAQIAFPVGSGFLRHDAVLSNEARGARDGGEGDADRRWRARSSGQLARRPGDRLTISVDVHNRRDLTANGARLRRSAAQSFSRAQTV